MRTFRIPQIRITTDEKQNEEVLTDSDILFFIDRVFDQAKERLKLLVFKNGYHMEGLLFSDAEETFEARFYINTETKRVEPITAPDTGKSLLFKKEMNPKEKAVRVSYEECMRVMELPLVEQLAWVEKLKKEHGLSKVIPLNPDLSQKNNWFRSSPSTVSQFVKGIEA